jgi:hypothetical protein
MSEPYPAPPPGLAPPPPSVGVEEELVYEQQPALDSDELEALFRVYLREAEDFAERLEPALERATRCYGAELLGDEEEGRSQVVLSVVRDTVRAALPSLLRSLTGMARPAEFAPREGEADQEAAAQATAWVEWAAFEQNDGWGAIHDAVLDALVRRVGWVRWWWDDTPRVVTETYDGLLEPQAAGLLQEEGVTALRVTRRRATAEEAQALLASPEGAALAMMPGVPPVLYKATVTRRERRAVPRLKAVPGEQILFDPDATCVEDARRIFHVRQVPAGELIAAGFDAEEVLAAAAKPGHAEAVAAARDQAAASANRVDPDDPSMRMVRYAEGWVLADLDGDGVAELLHMHAVGKDNRLLEVERGDGVPLACFSAIREAHRLVGLSLSDLTEDLQGTQSRVLRMILDSMSSTIFPRTAIVEHQANLDDALNTEVGAVIRQKAPGMVQELSKPFIGPAALPILDTLEAVRESRTGITRASQGLTAESLQSTTAIAVSAQMSAAQDRLELMAHMLARGGLKQLYAGLHRLLVTHQDRKTAVRLRGRWVPVDPRVCRASLDVVLHTTGRGATQERLQVLGQLTAKMEQVLQQYGPDNPLVTVQAYRRALADMLETVDVDPDRYLRAIPPDWQPPKPQPKPSPEEVLAAIERTKAEASIAETDAKLRLEREQLYLDDDRERDKLLVEAALRAIELQARHGAVVDLAQLGRMLARDPLPPAASPPGPPVPFPAAPAGLAPQAPPAAVPPVPPAGPPPMPPPLPGVA